MRKIEEIEAELKELPTLAFVTADMIEADTKRLIDELIHAMIAGIPLDRLKAICAAEKEGRLTIAPVKTVEYIGRGRIICKYCKHDKPRNQKGRCAKGIDSTRGCSLWEESAEALAAQEGKNQ